MFSYKTKMINFKKEKQGELLYFSLGTGLKGGHCKSGITINNM